MLSDNLAFYSDDDVNKMWAEWGSYYELLDLMEIDDDINVQALALRPDVPFSYDEVRREIFRRERVEDMLDQ